MNETPAAVVQRYYREVWEKRCPDLIPTMFAPQYRNHAGSRGTLRGPAGIRANYDGTLRSFPDAQFHIDDILSADDKVVIRYTMHGTHEGEFQGIAPTNRRVSVQGIGIYAVAEGTIVESWVVRDSLGLLNQINGK